MNQENYGSSLIIFVFKQVEVNSLAICQKNRCFKQHLHHNSFTFAKWHCVSRISLILLYTLCPDKSCPRNQTLIIFLQYSSD